MAISLQFPSEQSIEALYKAQKLCHYNFFENGRSVTVSLVMVTEINFVEYMFVLKLYFQPISNTA